MLTPIHHTFGPLAVRSQFIKASLLQWMPWKWREGKEVEELRTTLEKKFHRKVTLFDSGRSALLALLESLNLQQGDEVILQGYTCVVVPNAIIAAGGKPIYVDINPRTLNIDPALVREAVSRSTRAIICQHTFGIPADTSALRLICNEHDIALIEDCAHVIPTESSEKIGKHGDCILLSFGRDKAISGVTGGAVLSAHELLSARHAQREQKAEHLSYWKILNLIDYPIRYSFAKWIWWTRIAKVYLKCIQLCQLLPPILTKEERRGHANDAVYKLPNACAALAVDQLNALRQINEHRAMLTEIYKQAAVSDKWNTPKGALTADALQKFPLLMENAESKRVALKKKDIYLYDGWSEAVVNPQSVDEKSVQYIAGSCPNARSICQTILSLPTHPTMSKAQAEFLVHSLRS